MASRLIHVPYVLEQDEDGVWCAQAYIRPHAAAHGNGDTPELALADLAEALTALIAEIGAPQELALMLDIA